MSSPVQILPARVALEPATPPTVTVSPLAVRPEDGAALLSVSRTVMFGLLREKAIPSFTIGSARRIRVDDLKAYVDRLAEAQS